MFVIGDILYAHPVFLCLTETNIFIIVFQFFNTTGCPSTKIDWVVFVVIIKAQLYNSMYRNFLSAVCLLVFLHQTAIITLNYGISNFLFAVENPYTECYITTGFLSIVYLRFRLQDVSDCQNLLDFESFSVPFPSKKCYFASSRISIRSPYFLPLFIITFLCLQPPHEAQLFLRHPL